MRKAILFTAASLFAFVCSAVTHNVQVSDAMGFQPATLNNIAIGDTVLWTFVNSGHTTASGNPTGCAKDGKWDSGPKNPGETYYYVFTAAGEYPYFCEPHCPTMQGLITVSSGTAGLQADGDAESKTNLVNYPNPFNAGTTFTFFSEKAGKGSLEIFNAEGKMMSSVRVSASAGQNAVQLAGDLPEGVYVARLSLNAMLPQHRMIVRAR